MASPYDPCLLVGRRLGKTMLSQIVCSVISVVLGIVICEIGVAIANESHNISGIEKYTSSGSVNDLFIFLQLTILVLFYIASGFTTASIAKVAPVGHVVVVIAATLGLLYFYSLHQASIQVWYYPARAFIVITGILCGLSLALKRRANVETTA